jgi:YVTN family beta-propeller protein
MAVMSVAGALAWGNRPRAARKAKTPKVASPRITPPPNRRTTLPSRSTSSRIKRQTILGMIDVVPGVDGVNARAVDVNPTMNRVYVVDEVGNNVMIVDSTTNRVIGSVAVGAQPRHIAVNTSTNKIYVTNRNDNTVSVMDGSTNTVTATISVGTNPEGVGINPNTNKIYVANQNSNDVSVIDGATNMEVARVPVETFPTGVGVNPNTNRIYVSNRLSNDVSVIDGTSNNVIATVPVGGGNTFGVGVNPNTNRIYVANGGGNSVVVIDGNTHNVVNTIAVGTLPVEIAVNNVTNTVYVTNQNSNNLSVIDGATDTVTTTVPMGVFTQGVAVNTTRNQVYVANILPNTVNVVDGVTNTVTDVITIGSVPGGIATNPTLNRLYVPNGNASDTVSVIDGATNQVIGSAGVGSNPTEAAVNTATNRVYVVNTGDSTLSVIDGATNKTIKTTTVTAGANSVAVNSATNRVYVTSASLNQVVVVNGVNDSVVTTIAVGGNPKGIAVNPNTNRIYVANETGNSVSVIDGVNNTVLTTVPVGNAPRRIDVNPTTNMIYVTNGADQTLSVIDGATNTVTATIPLGFSLQDVAANPATNKVYVTDGVIQTKIIDGFTNTIVDVVTTANAPYAIAVNPNTGLVYLGNTGDGTVTVLHDPLSSSSATVFNTNDNGPGSLRQALMDVNSQPGTTVLFRIPLSDPGFNNADGVFIIRPNSPLPPISAMTMIDGTTQTQFTGDTNPFGPEIVLNGNSAGASTIGLVIDNAQNCVVQGLVINGFSLSGISINGTSATGNRIIGCYIGTNARGDAAVPNLREGVVISAGANNNFIGGTVEEGGNLISGNDGNGVEIRGTGSDGNRIGSNYIGTDRSGNVAVSNGGSGVMIDSSNNVVGGASSALNLISGNNMSGVEIVSGSNNVVQGNFIGTDVNGTFALGNGDVGVELLGSATNNLIGGTSAAPRNLISGNNDFGVALSGMSVSGNRVMGNIIGADVSGTAAIGNGKGGVLIDRGMNNVVGGAAGEGNLISGNSGNGVEIDEVEASGNVVQGNAIGTNVNGTVGVGNMGSGVYISDAPNNFIGGVGNAGNVISGNERNGVVIEGSAATGNAVQGNSIGGNKDGSAAIGNNQSGVVIKDAPGNVIGGAAPADGNVISGNGTFGVLITFAGATGNQLQHNLIGADKNGTADLGNALDGVNVNNAPNTVIQRNLISGNDGNGITLVGAGATGTAVRGNGIGVNRNGDAALGNTENGIVLDNGASGNTIGNPVDADMNVISGNGQNGILLNGATTTNNTVAGNFIGTDASGATGVGNGQKGISIGSSASNNLIGGIAAGAGNVISGNNGVGVELIGGASNNMVQGNLIGTDKDGASALGNANNGVAIISANNNVIGGISPGAGNVISGNDGHGVTISDASANNTLQGNLIGTDKNGASALGNVGSGVRVANASNNLIGGINPGEGNVISDNEENGVHILGTGTGNRAQGNLIGTDKNGAVALGNDYNGVLIDESSQNVIGGVAANDGNHIAHNRLDGVRVTNASATQNRILSNVIHDNGRLGINLIGGVENVFGVTANDPNDADGSPNKLQNFPVFTFVETDGNFTTVKGSLDSDPAHASYPVLIQFFVSNAADPSGFGEGKGRLASHVLNAPGSFTVNNLPAAPVGAMLTATATDSDGNTSEFSQAIPVSTMSLGMAHLSIGATPSVVEVDGQAAIEVRATDNLGNAVSDTNINFQTTGGTLSASADTTDTNGRAKVLLSHIPFGATTVMAETDSVSVTVEVKGVLRIGVPAGVNLLSFPLNVAAGQVDDLFRGGRVDLARWVPSPLTRLGHYEFFSQQPFDLNVGQGYWVRSDVAQTVEITNGTLPDPQQPARIAFERDTPGWDLRGNPSVRDLLFDIGRINVLENGVVIGTLADIARDGREEEPMVEPYCWKWTNDAAGAGYELVIDPRLLAVLAIPPDIGRAIADNHLEFGRGAYFFLRRPNLALEFSPELLVTHAARAQRTKREPVKPSVDNWTLGLQAQAASIQTGDSVIGVSEKIENDLQVKKSPPVTSQQFVDLSLLNAKNETLAWDVRAARAPKMTWDVLVTTNQTGTVSLTYPNLSRLPKNLQAYIVDPDSGKRQFLRTTTQYAFTADPSGITQKRLRIEVTSETDGKLRVNGLQATVGGSDAARLVRLSFVLNREATVRGRVLSPTGKIIRALTPMAAPRGLNVVSWDGKTQRGGVAGRGVYVIELVAEDGEGEQVRAVRLVTLR